MNLSDDQPKFLFGTEVEGKSQDDNVPPFYVSFNFHDFLLHNAMLYFGASHNLMPRGIMEKLGLDITRPYKYLFSFDSSIVRFLGLIKDLCVTLSQIPVKCVVMDIVVADIPPKYGSLLSTYWGENFQGTLHIDMTYATIPIFWQKKEVVQGNYDEIYRKQLGQTQ